MIPYNSKIMINCDITLTHHGSLLYSLDISRSIVIHSETKVFIMENTQDI